MLSTIVYINGFVNYFELYLLSLGCFAKSWHKEKENEICYLNAFGFRLKGNNLLLYMMSWKLALKKTSLKSRFWDIRRLLLDLKVLFNLFEIYLLKYCKADFNMIIRLIDFNTSKIMRYIIIMKLLLLE